MKKRISVILSVLLIQSSPLGFAPHPKEMSYPMDRHGSGYVDHVLVHHDRACRFTGRKPAVRPWRCVLIQGSPRSLSRCIQTFQIAHLSFPNREKEEKTMRKQNRSLLRSAYVVLSLSCIFCVVSSAFSSLSPWDNLDERVRITIPFQAELAFTSEEELVHSLTQLLQKEERIRLYGPQPGAGILGEEKILLSGAYKRFMPTSLDDLSSISGVQVEETSLWNMPYGVAYWEKWAMVAGGGRFS